MEINRGAKQVSIDNLTDFLKQINRLKNEPRSGASKSARKEENI